MSAIENEGTYIGVITDHAVNLSTNDFPQLVLSLEGIQLYDEESGAWCDWTDVPENQATAHLVLIDSKNNETLNFKQVQEAIGWDGKSFSGLAAMDLSAVKLQFRIEERTYQEKTNLRVTWIDNVDATPGKSIRKLDAKGLKELDARFKSTLKGKATPATAPAKALANVATTEPPAKAPAKAPPKAPATAKIKAPATTKTAELPEGKCTKDEAWETCVELKDDRKVTDEKLAQAWTTAVEEVAPDRTDDQITYEEWYLIREKVLAVSALF